MRFLNKVYMMTTSVDTLGSMGKVKRPHPSMTSYRLLVVPERKGGRWLLFLFFGNYIPDRISNS